MENLHIYQDIATRTNGDVYLGVVGPVRVGKSTFITKFMQELVLPNINDVNIKNRAIDELPQSGEGKTIMTTQPKFVPNEAVGITVADNVKMNVRLVDCVGYFVDGVLGKEENDKPRMVKTPWSKDKMPIEQAAEMGTNKVINEHATIGVFLTSDGTIGDLTRDAFVTAEEKVFAELNKSKKPFVIVVNSLDPKNETTQLLVQNLKEKYNHEVIAMDVAKMEMADINELFAKMLNEFVFMGMDIKMPSWMLSLPFEHPLIQQVVKEVGDKIDKLEKVGEFNNDTVMFAENDNFEPLINSSIIMGEGRIECELKPKEKLFYQVLSEQCGREIENDFQLISYIQQLAVAKNSYDKMKDALNQVESEGYGVVNPRFEDLVLDEPQVVKQGGRYGVKIKATAPSYHIMKVELETELQPLVGSEVQTQDFVNYLLKEFEENPKAIWDTNIFGRKLNELMSDGMSRKLSGMPHEAQRKMRKTLTKIVNEGKGGIICILL